MKTSYEVNGTGRNEFLSFQLGAEEYGIDILRVQEIRSYEQPTRIANSPAFLKGVVNLRGVIVPIVDLPLSERRERLLQFINRLEHQAVAGEEFTAAELRHRLDAILVLLQRRGEFCRSGPGQLRGRCIDHDDDVFEPAQRLLERDLALAPRQIARQQRVDVGIDRKVLGREETAADRHQNTGDKHTPGMAGAEIDNSNDDRCEHRPGLILRAPALPE